MEPILYVQKNHTVVITLNRPEAMNAMNHEMGEAFQAALARFQQDRNARVAIITGAGTKSFSAGADLKEMSSNGRELLEGSLDAVIARAAAGPSNRSITSGKPVIAAINGYCLAGGLELALSCDIRICVDHATFGLMEVTRGIIAAAGGTQRLTRSIPLSMAMEMLLTGRKIDAAEALRSGLVSHVVTPDELLPKAHWLADSIAANGPLAVRATKEAAYRGLDLPLADGLALEAYLSRINAASEDSREGPLAFAEKREPVWKGK